MAEKKFFPLLFTLLISFGLGASCRDNQPLDQATVGANLPVKLAGPENMQPMTKPLYETMIYERHNCRLLTMYGYANREAGLKRSLKNSRGSPPEMVKLLDDYPKTQFALIFHLEHDGSIRDYFPELRRRLWAANNLGQVLDFDNYTILKAGKTTHCYVLAKGQLFLLSFYRVGYPQPSEDDIEADLPILHDWVERFIAANAI